MKTKKPFNWSKAFKRDSKALATMPLPNGVTWADVKETLVKEAKLRRYDRETKALHKALAPTYAR